MWYTEQDTVALQEAWLSVGWDPQINCGSGSATGCFKACGLVDFFEWQLHNGAQVPRFFAQSTHTFLTCCSRSCMTGSKCSGLCDLFWDTMHSRMPQQVIFGTGAQSSASSHMQIGHCHMEQAVTCGMCCGRPQPVLEKSLAGALHFWLHHATALMCFCRSLTLCSYFPILRNYCKHFPKYLVHIVNTELVLLMHICFCPIKCKVLVWSWLFFFWGKNKLWNFWIFFYFVLERSEILAFCFIKSGLWVKNRISVYHWNKSIFLST